MLRVKTCTAFVFLSLSLVLGGDAVAQTTGSTSLKQSDVGSSRGPLTGDWRFKLGGTSYREGRDEGAAATFSVETRADYRFNSILNAHLEPYIDIFTGRVQERYENDTYESRIGLASGYLSLKPIKYAEARAGAINQGYMDQSLLISGHRAFPGLQEILISDTKPVNVRVMAQQTIPTSYSLNAERAEKEPLPSFQTQALVVESKGYRNVEWSVLGGHYNWSRLPDKVAYLSARAGNTVTGGDAAPGSRFKYQFDGYFWGGDVCACRLGQFDLLASYRGAYNGRAPAENRDAQLWSVGPRVRTRDIDYELKYVNYFLESDVTVARYARGTLGYTNRVGQGLEARANFKKQGFSLVGHWFTGDVVAEKATQNTMSTFELWVETDYASF